jgi:hypothetical protein
MLILSVCITFAINTVKSFQQDVKNNTMNKLLSFFGDMKCSNDFITDKDVDSSELFGFFTCGGGDDCFCGKYNNAYIKITEIALRRGVKNANTIFSGLFIMLDFDKDFKSKTVVKAKGIEWRHVWSRILTRILLTVFYLFIIWYFIYLQEYLKLLLFVLLIFVPVIVRRRKIRVNKEGVKLEDVVFSKEWDVITTDQIEARYLLTTAFMERILEVKRRFNGEKIDFSFVDNKLFIAIHTSKDMFETTSLFKSALRYDRIQNVIYQFYSIFSIIDLLKIKGTKENETN